ncbi:TetR/AcrR family transcriptional regulator [Xanthomonas arboricola]|uniref:AcrR family transcriptional regulator n=1 Tax=Xanthomonas arboricola TaxID=56448 RepID=A0AB73H4C3_9XANT|nr:TetR/AcrR family transcriptional regulator [Xanthomonas arboricola]MBB5672887.1 AcrR family transcriptional regulator [Xanthomonas arboricola]
MKNSDVHVSLLQATAALVSERGLADLTVQEVVKRAGVSKGALFHYFPSKQALLDAAFQHWLDDFSRRVGDEIKSDSVAHGKFTRAYVKATLFDLSHEGREIWAAFSLNAIFELDRMEKWQAWLRERLSEHPEEEVDQNLIAVRCDLPPSSVPVITDKARG